MVRTARFAFDNPRGPDQDRHNDPFDEDGDPLYEAPISAGDELPISRTASERPLSRSTDERRNARGDEGNRAASSSESSTNPQSHRGHMTDP